MVCLFFLWGLNKLLYKEAPPRVPTPYPFIHYFWWKRYPIRTASIDKWYPFHIPNSERRLQKSRFFSFKIDFLSHPREIFARSTQPSQAHSAPGLFFDRSRVLDQRNNTGCFAGQGRLVGSPLVAVREGSSWMPSMMFTGLRSPERSYLTYLWNYSWFQTFHSFLLLWLYFFRFLLETKTATRLCTTF